ncbi:hypothetical protein ACIA49_00295 [Kribbella sp. NPDC051587]|uniref:hypothetical protein n=1 Tax=Kribbella sp. NPDC051587 TaxID=3364119 RepID=UPI0037AD48EF
MTPHEDLTTDLEQQLQFGGMGRIRGHYEWDDDRLTPGQKKEGGLHQNLFDGNGKLRGNARFVPDDEEEDEPLIVTETTYVPTEQRRRTQEQEEFERAIAQIVVHIVEIGISKAKPLAQQWWRETARPAIAAGRAKMPVPRFLQGTRTTAADDETSQEVAATPEVAQPTMSSAEAQARYLAAAAAQAYSDEQMRLVTNARIVEGGGLEELRQTLAELPPDQVKHLIAAMATNPALLSEETLAELASILGRRALP